LLAGKYGRIRDVAEGPDGFLYFSTSNRDGRGSPARDDDRIIRLVPANK
jgi:glucose/arabinose dehydrogenase